MGAPLQFEIKTIVKHNDESINATGSSNSSQIETIINLFIFDYLNKRAPFGICCIFFISPITLNNAAVCNPTKLLLERDQFAA